MSRELSYRFEELPLVIDNGFSGALINGSALISYWTDGTWGITQVYLDGHKRRPAADIIKDMLERQLSAKAALSAIRYEERDLLQDRGSWMHTTIVDRLEHEWRDQVQDAVNNALESEREAAHA